MQKLVLKLNRVNVSEKSCVAAVIRPIGVYHSDFGHCRVAPLVSEIILTEFYVVCIHCKGVFFNKTAKSLFVKACEAVKRFNRCRNIIFQGEGLRLFELSLARFNGVNDVFFDFLKFLF